MTEDVHDIFKMKILVVLVILFVIDGKLRFLVTFQCYSILMCDCRYGRIYGQWSVWYQLVQMYAEKGIFLSSWGYWFRHVHTVSFSDLLTDSWNDLLVHWLGVNLLFEQNSQWWGREESAPFNYLSMKH